MQAVELEPAAVSELWTIYDATGIRPEWLAPVLWYESGFDPTLQNRQGAPYYGIGQSGAVEVLAPIGVTPADFRTWSQAAQLARAVGPMFAGIVQRFGPLTSGARVFQANLLPATLPYARALWQGITFRGSPYYESNRVLDPLHHGAITLSDLAAAVTWASSASPVQAAMRAAYTQRPDEKPTSPAFGAVYKDPRGWLLAPATIAAYALGQR